MSNAIQDYAAVVVGGGPAGSTAATELARAGHSVLLLDREGRIKPCGGAVPPKLLEEFAVPKHLLVNEVSGAAIISPKGRCVQMPIQNGFVGMVDRDVFDGWLRDRAAAVGADRKAATFLSADTQADGTLLVTYREKDRAHATTVRARLLIGADGANSRVAAQDVFPGASPPYVAAYHEIVESPAGDTQGTAADQTRCGVYYRGDLSPDFYAWVFPHGHTISVGVGSAVKGFSLRKAVARLREETGLDIAPTVRREGAPIPLWPRKRWDNGQNTLLLGDAAGVVAPSSGEGIYYAACSGRLGAEAADEFLQTGDARRLLKARRRFMKLHGRVFWVLGMMQKFWYSNDARRERFVSICADKDVQMLTWEAYMHKRLVRARPGAHLRIFLKDLAHLAGVVPP